MTSSVASGARERITVRRMHFKFTSDIPVNWGPENNAFVTAMMAALSASFPAGERFFIDSVQHYADKIHDPELKERVRRFVGQEANHTKEHLAFNRFLEARGIPVGRIEKHSEKILRGFRKRQSPAVNLAITVAVEHLTAFLASAVLEDPEAFFGKMHPTVAAFWGWHLVEELEHRAVAFDVYKACVGSETLRLKVMRRTTLSFSVLNLVRTASLLRATGNLLNLSDWITGVDWMFGRESSLRRTLPLYRAYFRHDFHPDEHDNSSALEQAKIDIAGWERGSSR